MPDIVEYRRNAAQARLHPESLLNVPLIKQVFSDLSYRFVPRAVDPNWWYERHLPIALAGFNPFEFTFYYARDSRFAAWLTDPFGSAREFNESDLLVRELLFMVHDYLHAWAYSAIDRICPSLQIFHGPITAANFEDYVFCHLLTETAATIGLDYWFLCQKGLNEICPIGSGMGPLTVAYREANLPEYRRFFPELEVQTPEFFRTLAVFYCSGEFPGFDADDLRRSPKLLAWLRHELSYGVTQRALTRAWLAYMAEEPIPLGERGANKAPVEVDTEMRQHLIDELGALLWAKIKHEGPGDEPAGLILPEKPAIRRAPPNKPPDFRFVNIAHVSEEQWENMQPATAENFKFFLYQFLGHIPFRSVPARKLGHIPLLLQQRDMGLALDLMGDLPRLEPLAGEPRDIMIAN